jgi:hypothetical protein
MVGNAKEIHLSIDHSAILADLVRIKNKLGAAEIA